MPETEVPASTPGRVASGLAVPFAVPPALGGFRQRWDRAALAGAGPHVTILYPFVPCEALGPADRTELAAIAGGMPASEVRFERVRRFADLVWIEPEPAEPFAALTAAVAERWPDHPPYGGTFETVIPHLTLVESEVAPLGSSRTPPPESRNSSVGPSASSCGARTRRVGGAPRWRIPFGIRP